MKRTELRRKSWIKRGTKPMKKRNAKRRESEFARCYHSRARVRWVKSQACVVCVALHPIFGLVTGRCDNAHTETDGMGRKAGYETIVPLCRSHHKRYDEHLSPLDKPELREFVKWCAPKVQAAWLLVERGSEAA